MFRSLISTEPPFSGSDLRRVASHPQAYRGTDPSRAAYARGLADQSRNALAGEMDSYRQEYQKRAERARSADLLGQRRVAQGQYELDRGKTQTLRQQDTRFGEGRREIRQYRELARRQADQQLLNDVLGAVFGSNNAVNAAPLIGNAIAGGARPLAGFSGRGLFGSLMGGL